MTPMNEWITFTDHPILHTTKTIYFWRTKEMGDFYSQDSRMFTQQPTLRFVVPQPPEDVVRAALALMDKETT